MGRLFIYTLLIYTLLACGKKKPDDPVPAPQEQKQATVDKPAAYWPLIRTEKYQCCPTNWDGLSHYETYEGHADSVSPKADKWRIRRYSRNTTTNMYDILQSDKIVLVWWVNDEPKSDYFLFKNQNGQWYRKISSNSSTAEWHTYTIGD